MVSNCTKEIRVVIILSREAGSRLKCLDEVTVGQTFIYYDTNGRMPFEAKVVVQNTPGSMSVPVKVYKIIQGDRFDIGAPIPAEPESLYYPKANEPDVSSSDAEIDWAVTFGFLKTWLMHNRSHLSKGIKVEQKCCVNGIYTITFRARNHLYTVQIDRQNNKVIFLDD